MRRESVMKVFRNILEKSGMKDLVSLSEPFPQKRTENRIKKLNKNTEIG